MLRLATLDAAGDTAEPFVVPPTLITRALGDLRTDRLSGRCAGFAIERFCEALVDESPRAAQAYVDRLLECGVGVEALYETYIPRAAARLGERWVEDRLAFTGVTLGMAHLTEVFRRLSPSFLREKPPLAVTGRRALFALAAGESHALGVVMAADYFQRGGWVVRVELMADAAELVRIVRERAFDVVGLSAGSRRMVPELRRTLAQLRSVAAPGTRFAVGGPIVALDPDIAATVDADLTGACASAMLAELEKGA